MALRPSRRIREDATRSMRAASSATPTAAPATSTARPRWCTCCARASSATRRATALLEVGGPSLSYGELWERARRVAGGLRARGVAARRPRGDPPAQRHRLGARLLRRADARRRRRAGQHPLHRRGGRLRARGLGRGLHVRRRRRAARRRAGRAARTLGPRGPRGDLLHERHDRLPEGRDDLARQLPDQQRERLALPTRSTARKGPRSRRSCRCRCSTSPAATAS